MISREPRATGRRWLGIASLVAFFLFLIDTLVVLNTPAPPTFFDVPVELAVQAFPWGPLTYAMELTNATGGWPQYVLGAIAVVGMLVYDRRAGWLLALGAIANLLDWILKVSVQRQRPAADVVTILSHNGGYSYASGHAVFFTWLCFMLAALLSPRLGPRRWVIVWGAAFAVILVACLGRVWAGAHWPSDVIGGFLLGLSWTAFVLWLAERWRPSPSPAKVRRR